MARTAALPKRGNYDFLELPKHLQQLIEATEHLEDAMNALDSAERAMRVFDETGDAQDRNHWRWYQKSSYDADTMYWRVRLHTEAVYVAWLTERADEERASRAVVKPLRIIAQGE